MKFNYIDNIVDIKQYNVYFFREVFSALVVLSTLLLTNKLFERNLKFVDK